MIRLLFLAADSATDLDSCVSLSVPVRCRRMPREQVSFQKNRERGLLAGCRLNERGIGYRLAMQRGYTLQHFSGITGDEADAVGIAHGRVSGSAIVCGSSFDHIAIKTVDQVAEQ